MAGHDTAGARAFVEEGGRETGTRRSPPEVGWGLPPEAHAAPWRNGRRSGLKSDDDAAGFTVDRENEPSGDPQSPPVVPVDGGPGQSMGNHEPMDAVEAALADAITKAAEAGRFDVVGQLAAELQARRSARAGNVVAIDKARRGTKR
jgi:hypothetical protein